LPPSPPVGKEMLDDGQWDGREGNESDKEKEIFILGRLTALGSGEEDIAGWRDL
jgi:hypothetical protein